MEDNRFEDSIKEYLACGWHPFPILVFQEGDKREKVPVFGWKPFQDRPPTESEISGWLKHRLAPFFGIAVALQGSIVLDFDHKDGKSDLSRWQDRLFDDFPMWTQTASGGFHFFFLNPLGQRNATNIFQGDKAKGDTLVDVRGEGGLIVVGPTCLYSSDPRKAMTPRELTAITPIGSYETHNLKEVDKLKVMPAEFAEALAGKMPKYHNIVKPVVKEGERNDTATSMAFKLLLKVNDRRSLKEAEMIFWEFIKGKFADWQDGEAEYRKSWESAVKKKRESYGDDWPRESAEELLAKARQEATDQVEYEEDMEKWNLQLETVLRYGDLVKYTMQNQRHFIFDIHDLYSQLKFRTAYTAGTNLTLPKISPKAYERFLNSYKIVDVVETGAKLTDILKEMLVSQYSRLPPSDSQEDATATVKMSFWARAGTRIYFSLPGLSVTQSWLMARTTPSAILLALKELNAYQVTDKGSQIWVYEMPNDYS